MKHSNTLPRETVPWMSLKTMYIRIWQLALYFQIPPFHKLRLYYHRCIQSGKKKKQIYKQVEI